jgi:hypothetical protein
MYNLDSSRAISLMSFESGSKKCVPVLTTEETGEGISYGVYHNVAFLGIPGASSKAPGFLFALPGLFPGGRLQGASLAVEALLCEV